MSIKNITMSFLICTIMISMVGCKKKVDYEQEQARTQAKIESDTNVVWKITTPQGTYNGHRLTIDETHNNVTFITEDGKKVYCCGTFQIETQGR